MARGWWSRESGRARGIIGGFEPNGVENWESMEGGVGRVGEPGGL